MSADRGRLTCPDCGGPVWPQRERLCPRCGYPLMFMQPETETEDLDHGVARVPGERDGTGMVVEAPRRAPGPTFVDEPPPAPQVGEIACPSCRHANPNTRVRCERCGTELRPAWQAAPPPPPPPPPTGPRPRGRLGVIIAVSIIVAALAGAGAYWYVKRGNPLASPPAPPPAATGPVLVDPKSVKVSASSTNPDDPRYKVAGILDGNRGTAWNSDGDDLKSNIGVSLTFTFKRPVRLARITLVNGYARTPALYRGNERVRRMVVHGDATSKPWALKDTADPQTLDLDGTATKTVTFVIEAVYRGDKYKDVAITEVSFHEQP